jgi:RNA polymerase sigma-70 factor (ECF subfamily)
VSAQPIAGEVKAAGFADLYRAYARDVYRFALYLSGDPALADDITSETFLRVWLAQEPVRLSSVKAWLFVIARNLYRHELRHSGRRAPLDPAMPAPDLTAPSAEGRQRLARVLGALSAFTEIDRSALLLRVAGFPYAEIASTLEISIAAAKVKVHRVRLRLVSLGLGGIEHEHIERHHS